MHYVTDVIGAHRVHHEPVEAERDPGTFRQACGQTVEQRLVQRRRGQTCALTSRVFVVEPLPLFSGVGQLDVTVREFEWACEDLEAIGDRGVRRADPGQRRLARRIMMDTGEPTGIEAGRHYGRHQQIEPRVSIRAELADQINRDAADMFLRCILQVVDG